MFRYNNTDLHVCNDFEGKQHYAANMFWTTVFAKLFAMINMLCAAPLHGRTVVLAYVVVIITSPVDKQSLVE